MKIIVAGYGKFGKLAVERLSVCNEVREIIVLDPRLKRNETSDETPVGFPASFHSVDAVQYLTKISRANTDYLIAPLTPFHLAASFIASVSDGLVYDSIRDSFIVDLPNVYRIDNFNVCCSYADFMCPDDCPENETCSVTAEIRRPMYERLATISTPDLPLAVLKSRQILPGLGGFYFGELLELINKTLSYDHFILATSCRCHAIMTGFSRVEL